MTEGFVIAKERSDYGNLDLSTRDMLIYGKPWITAHSLAMTAVFVIAKEQSDCGNLDLLTRDMLIYSKPWIAALRLL